MPKRILRNLTLTHISAVDDPCQEGAKAAIIKRRDPTTKGSSLARSIAKYVGTDDGAHTFNEVMRENRFSEAIWPLADAFTQAVRSIVADTEITAQVRDAKITTSVDEFLSAVRQLDPPEAGAEVEKQLRELISKREDPTMKTVEQLETEIATLKGQITTLTSERDTAVTAKTTAETALETEKAAHGETKKALTTATDETITVGGQELKKSVVGEASFSVAKAMRDERDTAVLEKRASDEFGHLPGTTTEKAKVLKVVEAVPDEDTRKAALAIFTAAEKMAAGGFGRLGSTGEQSPTAKQAVATFKGKVAEIMKRDSCKETDAMRKARTEFPDEFEAYQEAAADD